MKKKRSATTNAEALWAALASHLGTDIRRRFTPNEILKLTTIDEGSFRPVLQSMRDNEPGGAPDVAKKFQNVVHQVSRGVYELSEIGIALI